MVLKALEKSKVVIRTVVLGLSRADDALCCTNMEPVGKLQKLL